MSKEDGGVLVNGNGNRVAGGNYYENQSKPCCKCEVRFVTADRTVCNHCTQQEQAEKAKQFGMILLAAMVFTFVNLHQWRQENGLAQGMEGFFSSLLLSLMLVFLGGLAVLWIKTWLSQR